VTARARVAVPHVRAVATVGVAASVLLAWWLLSGRPQESAPVAPLAFSSTTGPAPSASAGQPTGRLIVDVVGKVRQPGIVTVPKGSRVYEAIDAAGGLRGRVDTTTLNLARELVDGEQVLVGIEPVDAAGEPASGAGGTGAAGGPGAAKINLNTATLEQLDTLPGVGPVTAQAILDWREGEGPFTSVDDLLDVKGIGDATLAELRDLVVV
jgi:competence protein ComEA